MEGPRLGIARKDAYEIAVDFDGLMSRHDESFAESAAPRLSGIKGELSCVLQCARFGASTALAHPRLDRRIPA